MPTKALCEYINRMIERYPILPDSVMSEQAGLSKNAIHRIRSGVIPKPETLKALADTWGRDPDEQVTDYRELMARAGYYVPEPDMKMPPEQAAWLKLLDGLAPEQHQRVQEFFASLAKERSDATPNQDIPDDATLERLLAVVYRMSPEERRRWVYESLQRLGHSGS